mgnify:CR=1 FL=1
MVEEINFLTFLSCVLERSVWVVPEYIWMLNKLVYVLTIVTKLVTQAFQPTVVEWVVGYIDKIIHKK